MMASADNGDALFRFGRGSEVPETNKAQPRAACHPRLAADEPGALQREHHLVHGRRADPEMALHVGLGRGTAMDAGVGVNEGQVLTLRVGEPCRGHRHTIDSSAPLATERHDDHTLPGRPERSRALRAPDPAARWAAGGPHAQRAQILLAADAGLPDETIAQSLRVGGSTVYRTRRRFVEGNLDKALTEEPRPGAKRKLTGHEDALLLATACSRPPEGRARWTIDLLAGEMVRLTDPGSLSGETVRRRLAEKKLKPPDQVRGRLR